MEIPTELGFQADITIDEWGNSAICFSCAVRYVMGGGKVKASLDESWRPCSNPGCEKNTIPKEFKES